MQLLHDLAMSCVYIWIIAVSIATFTFTILAILTQVQQNKRH
jgi:hypothetical protein